MADPSTQPSEFGKYRLIAELGQGGMADVFLAVQQGPVGFSKLVVVKRLRETFADDPEFIAMLLDEARLAARLNHPNIVQTNEVGEHARHHFIAMEYLDGQPLHRIVHRATKQTGMPLNLSLRILCDVLAGLHSAHELTDFDGSPIGVVHRDVSPHNIFITYNGVVKVVDFGIAKAVGRTAETRTGVLKGKVTYMAPEQAAGAEIDRRADLFAIGVLLWEALTQTRMWKALPDLVIVSKLVRGELPGSPKTVKPDIPAELERICNKALAHNPQDRYATAGEFRADLEAYLRTAGDHVGASELGELVSNLFRDRRQELKTLIERQLALVKANQSTTIEIDIEPMSATKPSLSLSGKPNITSIMVDTPRDVGAVALTLPEQSLLVTGTAPVASGRSSRSTAARLMGGAALLAAAVAGAYFGLGSSRADAPAMQREETVAIRLRAQPASARFRLDGGELLENPYLAQFPRDGKVHKLLIEADGFVSIEREIRFEGDVSLELSLQPEPTATPQLDATAPPAGAVSAEPLPTSASASASATPGLSRPRAAHRSSPKPPPPTVTTTTAPAQPAVTGRPKRQLDPESPWP